ncbi:DUF4369 domain-containing protein [Spongiimicrobium sp. 2-473A-2-J]|uniref:DUF4369 domain-containing protein n=1 Tax=Eudoraea algarum TaxID=3417568 RepID=UPI003D35ADF9
MKKLLSLIVLSTLIVSCSGDTENTMTVTGNVKGLKKGTLYLQKIQDTLLMGIDSLQIAGDGNFTFKTEVESPEIFYLYLAKEDNNDINDRIRFFGEPGVITINTAWNTFDANATISGSKTHKKFEEYKKTMSRYNTRNLEVVQAAYDPELQKDSLVMDSLERLSIRNTRLGYAFALNFALNNTDSEIAPYIALYEVSDANPKYLDSIYNALTPEVSNSKYGLALGDYLKEISASDK